MRFRLTVTIALLLLIAVQSAAAQDISPELQTQIDGLEAYTASTRQLAIREAVTRAFPSREDAIAQVREIYAVSLPQEDAERLSQFYVAFEFFEPGTDYINLLLSALDHQMAGYYDSETEVMNTLLLNGGALGDELPLLEQITYVHEFTHALQDQHFDLDALDLLTRHDRDQSLALFSLIEGDATTVMNIYTQALSAENPLRVTLQLLSQGLQAGALSLPPGLPDIVSAELLGQYTNGAIFVAQIQANGGWAAVDQAYDPGDLPQSTEQILHPEKYLSGEAPLPVNLSTPDLDPAWSQIWETTFGEFYLREYLKMQLPTVQANDAATGWGGDRVQIYRHSESDALAWLMRIEWDSPAEAEAFTGAYVAFARLRFPDVQAQESCWAAGDAALCFSDSAGGHLIAFAPSLDMARALVASQG